MDAMRSSISKRKRRVPVTDPKRRTDESRSSRELSWATAELQRMELLMELEEMDNDRNSGGLFTAYGEL